MDFEPSPVSAALSDRVQRFTDDLVLPSYPDWRRYADAGVYPLDIIEPLKQQARTIGLWNLFLPGLRDDQPGTRVSSVDYAPLCEIMGRVPWSAEVFNCSAPDSGNIELLQLFATPMQRRRWLDPLLAGEIRSCFAMSEPDVASSDATNIETCIDREGSDYVVNGRKRFITGAAHSLCRIALVMGRSGTDNARELQARHSILIVPREAPGLTIERNIPVMDHQAIEGHCELVFREGNAAARTDVAGIEPVTARLQTRVLDRAMQIFGAMGLTPDTPLARLWSWGRAMRFFDGPDEVHLRTVARNELSKAKGR